MDIEPIEHMLETVVKTMVMKPGSVRVRSISGERDTLLKVVVSREDLYRVLGPQGRTADALRQVLRSVSAKEGGHFRLDVESSDDAVLEIAVDDGDEDEEEDSEEWEADNQLQRGSIRLLRLAF